VVFSGLIDAVFIIFGVLMGVATLYVYIQFEDFEGQISKTTILWCFAASMLTIGLALLGMVAICCKGSSGEKGARRTCCHRMGSWWARAASQLSV
jgi:hypothetical protein